MPKKNFFLNKKNPKKKKNNLFHSTSRDPNCISLKKRRRKRRNAIINRQRNYEFPSSNLKLHLETPFFPLVPFLSLKEFHPRPRPISSPPQLEAKIRVYLVACGTRKKTVLLFGKKCSGRIEKSPGGCVEEEEEAASETSPLIIHLTRNQRSRRISTRTTFRPFEFLGARKKGGKAPH